MRNEPVRIILVDDHQLVRESWKVLLENNPSFKVICDCNSGVNAVEQTQRLMPDIVLVDINMSPVNGFALTEKLRDTVPNAKVIGLSVNNQPKYAARMIELGARGYITKTSSLEEIHRGISQVNNGAVYICDEIRAMLDI